MVIGVSMCGLTIAQGMPWIINAIGAGFVGFALGGCGDIALIYVQGSYQFILSDALVGVVFVRNAISTGMIFAVPPWMTNMGIYDMFVVCAVLAAVIALTHLPLLIWGRRWRIALAPEYQKYAQRQY
ncbi:hypothetical protein LTR70_009176 [Exophiala xenobiotica]|uniref:Uncharacterized protein n=1 Tax=Lithohypha guttulata TaxID=1690604 RepID=A0ABR0KA58_9EURO|nr:hypothetical protein LTR24_004965 [Lithohypha guttulata]KAK5310885.1 hypothetical protein LTR70_009176 [Exophiala xenobiotica]